MSDPNLDDETRCAVYLKALADSLRLQIIRALQNGPLSVSDLALALDQEIGTVSHHLRVLYHADLVTTEREGKFIYYSLNKQVLGGKSKARRGALDFGCCKLDMGPIART
ncbi:HTH-type transcriptional regulator NmtR [Rosistilla oblonga]|uniref:ArsR/SmtB family transcription factor n=1 Tax=Rosistilla oblonga TaxID=2527990 RepID=UPI00118863DC|nr:metalloregulator ArsR/SmtB family transcription factor [Rosistilla oblonga]QDV11994.1 HTH-type transcriptional regulator NmtR [Rosistilla oblonga]